MLAEIFALAGTESVGRIEVVLEFDVTFEHHQLLVIQHQVGALVERREHAQGAVELLGEAPVVGGAFAGISTLAIVAAMNDTNGGLYLALMGQFVETSNDIIFTMEASVRTARR